MWSDVTLKDPSPAGSPGRNPTATRAGYPSDGASTAMVPANCSQYPRLDCSMKKRMSSTPCPAGARSSYSNPRRYSWMARSLRNGVDSSALRIRAKSWIRGGTDRGSAVYSAGRSDVDGSIRSSSTGDAKGSRDVTSYLNPFSVSPWVNSVPSAPFHRAGPAVAEVGRYAAGSHGTDSSPISNSWSIAGAGGSGCGPPRSDPSTTDVANLPCGSAEDPPLPSNRSSDSIRQ